MEALGGAVLLEMWRAHPPSALPLGRSPALSFDTVLPRRLLAVFAVICSEKNSQIITIVAFTQ